MDEIKNVGQLIEKLKTFDPKLPFYIPTATCYVQVKDIHGALFGGDGEPQIDGVSIGIMSEVQEQLEKN